MSQKEIDELVKVADCLCKRLDIASQNEKAFCDTIQCELERMSWETLRIANNLKEIQTWGT